MSHRTIRPGFAPLRGGRSLSYLSLAALLVLTGGCAPYHGLFRPQAVHEDCSRPSLVFFFVDGLDFSRLNQMLADGELPHIRQRFVEGGVQVRHAFSSLPSITYPNCATMITGVFPGHHGILGNFWFDRDTFFAHYYMTLDTYRTVNGHFDAPTLYDALHDQFTFSIQHHTRRGVTRTLDNKGNFVTAWLLGRYSLADHRVGRTAVRATAAAAGREGRWPRVIMTYYPGVDEVGHRSGSQSAAYGEALETIDEVVGRITRQIEQAGRGGSTYYALVTDHSHPPVARHVDILKWVVCRRGVRLRTEPVLASSRSKRARLMERYDAVGSVDAGRTAMFHLRDSRGWAHRLGPEAVLEWITRGPSLLEVPAVEIAALRGGEGRVRVLSREGVAVIERREQDGVKQYRVVEQEGDLLHASGRADFSSFVAAGWHASREWLAVTADHRRPDLVPQVVEMFDSPHTGDVVLFAAEGWGFAFGPAENGGHGSCLACDMRVPMMFSGPDLPRGAAISHARLVDVAPTVLGLIGEADRIPSMGVIDGINLAEELRRAK